MTRDTAARAAAPLVRSRPTTDSPYLAGLTVGLALSGAFALIAALWHVDVSIAESVVVLVLGLLALVGGLSGLAAVRLSRRPRLTRVFGGLVVAMVTVIAMSTALYLVTGTFAAFDNALFESISGVSTTGLTLVEDPAVLPRSILFWRAGTQWIGGLIAVTAVVALFPFFGGNRELIDHKGEFGSRGMLVPGPVLGMPRVAAFYAGITIAIAVAFRLAGMGLFDALTHGLTTSSTGGFSNHSTSFAHFDSPAIEWVATIAMFTVGASLPVLWTIVTGRVGALWEAFEMRVYLAAAAAATVLISAWTWREASDGATAMRHAAFSVASVMSTTGHRVTDWTEWVPVGQTVLLMLMGIGAMSGAVGGGYTWLRAIEVVKYMRRELTLLLHPQAIVRVKVGGVPVSAEGLNRTMAHQILILFATLIGAFGIAAFGGELVTAVTAAISAVSTVGPALGDLGAFETAEIFGRPARVVLMALMLAGRLSVFPVLVVLAAIMSGAARRRSRARPRWW